MNITLLMNETEPISCQSVNVIPDNIDDYTNLSSVQYVHKHNTNSNNNNIISNTNNHNILSTNHKSNPNGNTNELSTTDYTNTRDNLNSSSNCTSPNNSILTMYGTQHRFKISPNTYHDVENGNNLSTMSISTRPDTDVDSAFPPKKLYTDDIPVLESFPGFYGFDLYRPLCGDTYEASETKPSTAFFYFKDEQGWTNLYAKKTPTWWTLSYWCQRKPPDGSFIRLTPVYGASDKQQEVIQRCFEDFMAIPTIGMGRYSIVMVGNSLAEYFFDPITERLCVTLPYETPKEGCEYSQFNGKFMCFNSCLYNGGQGNKKPLFLIITLEHLITG
ncbi:Cellular tumor antigen p53 isoform 3 [Schistosoma japonicum]|uniref:Cellular tumor antigen p53 isoform 3 n=1 Tax=Schistosoma japonicum TaxID=6182 RepID=A0A4Z2CR84_SCHJA|nr:Cellular tumor antigen p53 isoform 3 [Schistosoma japonicum]